ncbi:agglutinin isoform X1 [Cryptomeria japonica]|uniref:agglutinin isoform X1 n=3 Tax=Cryptomeria japonica TaxID=3369 RepID=UPI0027DA7900|nr:agglutinin isoform X1 [Cryptomeria japonica]
MYIYTFIFWHVSNAILMPDPMGSRKTGYMSRVIKVKYEDEMRRINVKTEDGRPDISVEDLKSKICNLFELNGDAHELKLRYTDEDGDVIVIANEDDFLDACRQNLFPFRMEVSFGRNKGNCLKRSETGLYNLGPCGGGGGAYWNDGTFEGINGITVTMDTISLISIQFNYATANGTTHCGARHGGAGEAICTKFEYPKEKLQKISGYCGIVCDTCTVIKGLSFETNLAKYGPFGVADWATFEFNLRAREVVGVYGRACTRYLGSIGLYVLP